MMMKTKFTNSIKMTLYSLSILLFFPSYMFAQRKHENPSVIKFLDNKYHRINDTLYACEIEVTNIDYKNFLIYYLSGDYEKCKIDSSLWQSKFEKSYNYPMVKYYHTHAAFNYYPVVNISYYGAVQYCEWLTNRYNRLHLKSRAKFKLPTAQEWTLLSNTNPETGLPFNLLSGKNQVGKYLENIKAYRGDSVNLGEDGGFYTVRTDAYAANLFGLYNVIGNAAEMTDIKDVQKGGSWLDDLKDCTTDKVQTYVTPDPRVGFRVVMIINTR
jgi:formylglycine-generating enzyme required for sulfatase activity